MMTHDPLCPQQPRSDGATLTMLGGTPIYCACDLIAKVRQDERDGIDAVRLRTAFNEQGYRDGQRDMFAKCIAAVEQGHPRGVRWWADWLFWTKFRRRLVTFGYDWHKSDALETLRALQEKP